MPSDGSLSDLRQRAFSAVLSQLYIASQARVTPTIRLMSPLALSLENNDCVALISRLLKSSQAHLSMIQKRQQELALLIKAFKYIQTIPV